MADFKISNGLVGSHPPLRIKPMVFSDTVNIDFENTPGLYTKYARRFIPDQSGTIRLVFHDDSTFDKVVVAGTKYVYTVKRFNLTGTVSVTSGEMHN